MENNLFLKIKNRYGLIYLSVISIFIILDIIASAFITNFLYEPNTNPLNLFLILFIPSTSIFVGIITIIKFILEAFKKKEGSHIKLVIVIIMALITILPSFIISYISSYIIKSNINLFINSDINNSIYNVIDMSNNEIVNKQNSMLSVLSNVGRNYFNNIYKYFWNFYFFKKRTKIGGKMNTILLIIAIIFIICITIKIFLLKYSIKEIEKSFDFILNTDTNSIISISSSDKDIKKLATSLNREIIILREQKLQCKNGNDELKKIVTNISHDLRTPLTVISGYIDLIKTEKNENNKEEYLKIIKNKTIELNELTNQLFEFSKFIDIDTEMVKEKCCINEILEETLISYYNIFNDKNIIPQINICKEKIYKEINKISIIRVFENVLSNAAKYSDGDLNIVMNKDGKIIFSNTAKRLDSTSVQKIFDRYFSVENAKETNGIGLSIAKQLIELNNGKINAKYINKTLIIEISFK